MRQFSGYPERASQPHVEPTRVSVAYTIQPPGVFILGRVIVDEDGREVDLASATVKLNLSDQTWDSVAKSVRRPSAPHHVDLASSLRSIGDETVKRRAAVDQATIDSHRELERMRVELAALRRERNDDAAALAKSNRVNRRQQAALIVLGALAVAASVFGGVEASHGGSGAPTHVPAHHAVTTTAR